MPLEPGARVGPYEVVERLGAGGMGVVYRARDAKLNRDVALKVLLPEIAADPDRVARFAREGQVLATLNHPNIAAIYGVEEIPGSGPCIAMELVPGRDLAEMLTAGPLPLPDTLAIARQIAEALEAAHEAGLIHRDLKPANVKVRDDGMVKILDFGLAKAVETGSGIREPGAGVDLANSPTMAPAATTQPGLIVGTVAYMSPEQAKAHRVDKRTDIWAFGVILHEMLTGRNPFHADTMSEVLAAVLTRPIDVADLPPGTPQRLRTLIRRCLARDQRQRLRDIGDARLVIDEILAGTPDVEPIAPPPVAPAPAWRRAAPWTIAALAIVAAAMTAMRGAAVPSAEPRLVTRTATSMPMFGLFVALSPDGRNLAFSSVEGARGYSILLRPLDRLEARPIAGTEDGRFPVFSPDGGSIAFFTLRNGGTIRRVSINGGDVIDIGPGSFPGGAAWSTDNTIVFAGPADGLWRISANGGTPEALTKLDPDADVAHTRPQFLSGNRILFTIRRKSGKAEFAILDNGATRVVAPGGDNGRFVASGLGDGVGHLVFGRDETLFALPFDINRLEAVGVETPVVERVARNGPRWMFDYTVSADGWLVYSRAQAEDEVSLAWIESSGATTPVATQTLLGRPRLSPDARQAAGLLIGEGDRADIAVVDLTRGTTTRLTSAGANRSPVWTPDGRRIVFGGAVDQTRAVYVTEADGSTAPRQLFTTAAAAQPMAISPDGRTLVYAEQMRLWLRALDGSGQSRPLHESPPGFEIDAHLSPDGKWIVYTADDTGRGEAYMHEFPGPGRRERVSTNGAVVARWVDGGRAIVYWDNSGQSGNLNVMRVPVQPGPAIKLQSPLDVFSQGAAFAHDVTADGSRFLGFAVKDGRPTTLVLVTGWFEELRARAPMAAR